MDWQIFVDHQDRLVGGFTTTLKLTFLTFALAFIIGLIIAACRVSPVPPLNRFATFYVATFRNTPLVVLLALFFFGFPKLGFLYSPFVSGVIVLSAYTGAYVAEVIRSGINAVDQGQAEAARAIGLNFRQVLGLVVLPQAVRTVVPPIGNLFVANAKNTSILLTISVFEFTKQAFEVNNQEAAPVLIYLAVMLGYLAIVLPAGFVFGRIERRVAIKR